MDFDRLFRLLYVKGTVSGTVTGNNFTAPVKAIPLQYVSFYWWFLNKLK